MSCKIGTVRPSVHPSVHPSVCPGIGVVSLVVVKLRVAEPDFLEKIFFAPKIEKKKQEWVKTKLFWIY